MLTIAVSDEDKKIYAVKTVTTNDAVRIYEKVTRHNEITEHALNVIAKYMTDNNLKEVNTEFGILRLQPKEATP